MTRKETREAIFRKLTLAIMQIDECRMDLVAHGDNPDLDSTITTNLGGACIYIKDALSLIPLPLRPYAYFQYLPPQPWTVKEESPWTFTPNTAPKPSTAS